MDFEKKQHHFLSRHCKGINRKPQRVSCETIILIFFRLKQSWDRQRSHSWSLTWLPRRNRLNWKRLSTFLIAMEMERLSCKSLLTVTKRSINTLMKKRLKERPMIFLFKLMLIKMEALTLVSGAPQRSTSATFWTRTTSKTVSICSIVIREAAFLLQKLLRFWVEVWRRKKKCGKTLSRKLTWITMDLLTSTNSSRWCRRWLDSDHENWRETIEK